MKPATTPVTVLTGALGAGKTTLAAAALAATPERSVGVIVNEIGEIGIDGALLSDPGREDLVELSSGCLCCSSRAELEVGLVALAARGVDQILIETTGVADPGPVIDAITSRPATLRLGGVVCVVDARNLAAQLADRRRPQLRRQIGLASTIILSKTDLVGTVSRRQTERLITELNSHAALHAAVRGDLPPETLLDAAAFDPARVGELTTPATTPRRRFRTGITAAHPEVETIAVQTDRDLDLAITLDWLRGLMAFKGPDLNRVKGILAIDGMDEPVVIHGVHGYLESARGPAWLQRPRTSTIVAIGHDLDQQLWQTALNDCTAQVPSRGAS